MTKPSKSFIVYRRVGNRVTPHTAVLLQTADRWVGGKPEGGTLKVAVGPEISWSTLYAGHTGWIADQLDRTKRAISAERDRRAAKKQGPAVAPPVA